MVRKVTIKLFWKKKERETHLRCQGCVGSRLVLQDLWKQSRWEQKRLQMVLLKTNRRKKTKRGWFLVFNPVAVRHLSSGGEEGPYLCSGGWRAALLDWCPRPCTGSELYLAHTSNSVVETVPPFSHWGDMFFFLVMTWKPSPVPHRHRNHGGRFTQESIKNLTQGQWMLRVMSLLGECETLSFLSPWGVTRASTPGSHPEKNHKNPIGSGRAQRWSRYHGYC